jgi:hypothetical protein
MVGRTNSNGNPPYRKNMIQFFVTPGASGKIRLKIEKPTDSSGVIIRYKTTPWASGDDRNTGTLVSGITDDTNYKGINQWYEITGLTNGTIYYFKAFPYKNESYNQVIGVNETVCKAGGLLCEITADSISGSTATDTSSNANNGTISGITATVGKVGNEFVANGSNQYVSLPSAVGIAVGTAQTIICWIKATSLPASKYFYVKMYGAHIRLGIKNTGEIFIYNGTSTLDTGIIITTGNHYLAIVKWNGSNQLTLKVRDVDDASWSTYTSSSAPASASSPFNIFGDASSDLTFNGARVDQFRILNRLTTDDEDNSYWNGGAGC